MLYKRYLFGKIGETFAFFLSCIFVVFTIIDLSIHGVRFFASGFIGFLEICVYYFYNFVNHLEFFLPLTFLLSLLKVVLDLNTHSELVAFQMAGLTRKKILEPFFLFAGLLTLLSYCNQEFLAPKSQEFASSFRRVHKTKEKKEEVKHLFSVPLEDETELVYQEKNGNELFDVYWIRSNKDLWYMKNLTVDSTPRGNFVDHFVRKPDGKLEKGESYESKFFPELNIDPDLHLQAFIPFENRSLSLLFMQSFKETTEKKTALVYLHQKLSSPMLCLLVLILSTPFLMSFSRFKKSHLITASSLFIFACFMTVLEGMFILGENHVVSSFAAVWGPILFALMIGLPRFIKL